MVRRSHRDGPGSANQAPRDRASGTNGATDVPAEGQHGGAQGPAPGPVTAWPVMAGGGVWVCSVTLTWFLLVWKETQEPGLRLVTARRVTTWSGDWSATTLTWFHEWAGGVLLGNHLLPGERGRGKWTRDARFTTLLLLRPRDWGNCSFIDVLGTAGCWASGGTETKRNKRFSTRPSLRGREWRSHHLPLSSLLHLRVARLRASCTCAYRQVWRGPGRAWASCLRPAPRRCLVEGCCGCAGAGAAAEGRPRRRAGWGTAAGVEAAGFLRRMMCLIASVCFCAAEKLLGKALDRVAEEAGLRHGSIQETATFSCSFMSARHSQRWRSWTTSVDNRTTQRTVRVTFVARSARSVAARSSCRTVRSWPPSCRSFRALAWWTCSNAMACRAEAASPQAL